MLNFQNCRIAISGQNIICDSASINESNSLSPIFGLGFKGIAVTSPSGPIKNTINLSYNLEIDKEPIFGSIKNIRNYDFNSFPIQVVVGGITGAGYPSNYSLSIIPHDVVKVSVTLDIFSPLTGTLQQQNTNEINNYNTSNGSGLGHYHSTYIKSNDGTTTGSILQLNYSFSMNWSPQYKIGNPYPIEVKLLSANENFDFISEYEKRINITGKSLSYQFTDFDIIEINKLSKTWGVAGNNITLYPGSGKITANRINVGEGALILQETTVAKFY